MPKDKVKNDNVIIEREIFRSGVAIDGRHTTPKLVRQIFNNTKALIIDNGITLPVKEGHDDRNQELKGQIKAIRLKKSLRKNLRCFDYSIIATIELTQMAFDKYKQGLLPNLSVEIAPEGFDETGQKFGDHIYSLAMLGIDPPALPWLCNRYKDNSEFYFSININKKEYSNMDEKFQVSEEDVLSLLMKIKDIVIPAIESLEGASEEAKEEEPPPEEPKEENSIEEETKEEFSDKTEDIELDEVKKQLSEMSTKNADLERQLAFAELHKNGQVETTEKDQFNSLATKTGVKYAIEFYSGSKRKVKTPPKNKSIPSNRTIADVDEKEVLDKFTQAYSRHGMKGEQLERYAKKAAEKELLKIGTNGRN